MPNAINIADQIKISAICQYMISGDNAKKKIFNAGVLTDKRPLLLYITQSALSFGETLYAGQPELDAIANYNIHLCGEYYNIAKSMLGLWNPKIISGGSGSENYTSLTILRDYPDFIVGAMGSPMANNQSVLVINDAAITPETNDGSIEIHVDGIKLSNAVAGITNYSAFYAPGSFTITFNPELAGDGDPLNSNRVSIKYPVKINIETL